MKLPRLGGLSLEVFEEGITVVIRPGRQMDVVSENELGESCYASPAISQGQIFIRGEQQLYSVGNVK